MNKSLSKAELLSSVRVLKAVEFETQLRATIEQGAQTEGRQEYGQTGPLDGIAIARAELSRRRRNLGRLTPEQEVAIENLLFSTVNRISELVGRAYHAQTIKAYSP